MSSDEGLSVHPILVEVAAHGLHDRATGLPDRPLPPSVWAALLLHVRIQRVAGQLAALVEHGGLPVTEEQRANVVELHTEWMELALILEADLLRTGALLEGAGVPYRVLKGPAFAHLDYPDPSLRLFGDIDLLVPSASYDMAIRQLAAHGHVRRYREVREGFDRRFGKGANLTNSAGRAIDLHRTLAMGPFGLTVDLEGLWQSSRPFELAGRQLLALDDEHRFLHACYHAAIGNRTPRLVPLRDLAGMLQRPDSAVDVDRAMELARRWHALPVVAHAVQLAWKCFSLSETELSAWSSAFQPSRQDRRSMATYLDPEMGYAARCFAALRVVPGVAQKAAFVWAMAFPDRDFGAGRHRRRRDRWKNAARQIARMYRRPRR